MQPKTKMIRVRVTEAEYSQIENDAWGRKMRISEHVRSVLLPGRGSAPAKPAKVVPSAEEITRIPVVDEIM